MAQHKVEDIRNIVFCGHGSAGKTTLAETLLAKTGAINHPASVEAGTSICDFDEEEKTSQVHRRIQSGALHSRWQILQRHRHARLSRLHRSDSRGSPRRRHRLRSSSMRTRGSRSTHAAYFQEAGKAGLGRIIVISKMDSENIEFQKSSSRTSESPFGQCLHTAERANRRRA